jgi:acyl transferase domain-containing protein
MLAVKALPADIEKQLSGTLAIAAYNSPDLSVVSGPTDQIEIFSAKLQANGIPNRLIKTSHAFHSSMMDGMKENYSKVVQSVSLNPPRTPLVSSVTGNWMSEAEACSPAYWIDQIRLPVRFTDAIKTLWEEPSRLLLEVGPGNAVTTFAKQQSKGTALNSIAGFEDKGDSEYAAVLRSIGKLWQNGLIPEWDKFYGSDCKNS